MIGQSLPHLNQRITSQTPAIATSQTAGPKTADAAQNNMAAQTIRTPTEIHGSLRLVPTPAIQIIVSSAQRYTKPATSMQRMVADRRAEV